ncbi:TadE/TadG family type IV pilus assembly protein [Mesorhizobium huakuii]|uniref:TadE/TadG family type IV pilus assembly protein n=1 Tax=Mesorhizobium huakuii TaxID=28104 RepID=A0ABZ0W004_9HYPH|nr:TadE/TadG family type IV pilus assembly protein [Mesorhizobium huakuii]WQC02374.1 TadE/TadG family type IV pilus assembly protein [Mesorhizobium huakuii]
MLKVAGGFARSRGGSMMPLFFLSLVPLITAVGFSVDYTDAVQTRSNMQEALDAATLAITTLPPATTLSARQQALQDNFTANNGEGTTTLVNYNVAADGSVTAQTSASYAMPTDFMTIARINTVPVAVTSGVHKAPGLVQATFKVSGVSGWWSKTMTLYGTQFGATVAKPLMTIAYTYGNTKDPKGYGTTIVNAITTNSSGQTVTTMVQKQVCSVGNNPPNGVTLQQDSFGTNYYCVDTMYPANSAGAAIDVSQMGGLYLQMNVPSGNPQNLYSNDPATSNRLYSGAAANKLVETTTGQTVDIFSIVPCGQTSYQAWEDGGTTVPAAPSNADFFYNVTGKCDFNQRPSLTALTQ